MDRRKALAVAGTVSGILLAAGGALAANFGFLSTSANADPVGQLPASLETIQSTDTTQPQVTIVYQDVYDQGGAPSGSEDTNDDTADDQSESSTTSDAPQVTQPRSGGDDFSDDDHHSDDDRQASESESERDDDD